MITIFDTRVNMKDGLSGIPIRDIDWSTDLLIHSSTQSVMQAVQMSDLVIIVDYDDRLFRVIKDRHNIKYQTSTTDELGDFLAKWVEEEQFAHDAWVDGEEGEGNG